jgi:hypothetical protein
LQAVDAEFLEEVIVRSKGVGRNLEMHGGQLQHFRGGLVQRAHKAKSTIAGAGMKILGALAGPACR